MPNSLYTASSPQCPNQAQWLRYRRNQASPLETRAIEEHFSDCALCSEAIDTIMSTDADVLEAQWLALEQRNMPALLQRKPLFIKRFLTPIAVAATLVGLIGGAVFLFRETNQQQHQPIAQNTSPAKPYSPPDTTLHLNNIAQTEPISTAPITSNQQAPSASTVKNTIAKSLPTPTQTSREPRRLADQVAEADVVLKDNELLTTTAEAGATVQEEKVVEAPPSANPSAQADVAASIASKKEAVSVFSKQKLQATTSNYTTESGIDAYNQGRFAEAIPLLEQQAKATQYQQQSALYLADAYQKTGNKQAARKLLQKIIARKGPNTKQAQHMLDLLEKD
jgi:hypothetical protein